MGDFNRGETFANGESLTGARLNKLQDDMTLKIGVVGNTHIADGAVSPAKLSGSFAFAAGQIQITSGSLIGGNGSNLGVAIAPDASTIEISGSTLRVKDAGITSAKIANLGVATGNLAARAVNAAKFAAVTTARLLGRFSAGPGDYEEVSLGSGLALSGSGVLSATATARSTYVGAQQSLPAGSGFVRWDGSSSPAWPFSAVPEYCEARLVCVTADAGFSVGTEVSLNQTAGWWPAGFGGAMPFVVSTGAQVHFYAGAMYLMSAAGAHVLITRANWRVKLYAEKW
jgi:hypothetical protein